MLKKLRKQYLQRKISVSYTQLM